MIHIITKSLKIFLCFCLILPTPLFAETYMGGAKKTVQALEDRAHLIVDNLILVDVINAIQFAAEESIKTSQYGYALESFITKSIEMEAQYDKFLLEPQVEYVTTRKSIEDTLDKYLSFYTKQIDMAWIVSEHERQRQSSVKLINMALGSLKNTCQQGRFNPNVDARAMLSEELPAYDFTFRKIGHSSTFLNLLDYQGVNYHHDEKLLQAMYQAGQFGLTASSILISSAVVTGLEAVIFKEASLLAFKKGFIATTSSSTFSSALLAATPYIIAAVVVMIIVTDFVNRRKMEKLKRKRLEAEHYKFENTPRTQWIENEYKERCSEVIQMLNPIAQDLDFIEKFAHAPQEIVKYYKEDISDLKKEDEAWSEFALASCQKDLAESYEKRACVTTEEFINLDIQDYQSKNKSIPTCIYNEQAIAGTNCNIMFDQNGELDIDKDKIQSIVDSYSDPNGSHLDDLEKRIKILRYQMYNAFAHNYESVSQELYYRINTVLDQKRRSAFQRLLKLAGIYAQSSQNQNQIALDQAAEGQKELYYLENEFQDIVSLAVSVTFEKSSPTLLLKSLVDFKKRFETFHQEHLYMTESIDLNIRLKKLQTLLQLKL
ncbi:MAG: hypothetical protein M9899_05705 [Bdellovibrionaceae bacterium]|nr:hypothetical protein [Pseudobdellovibrionaceae bacterium]